MRTLLLVLTVGLLPACGPVKKPTIDAGPDTSCGLDCANQEAFGLISKRCFEYSTDPSQKENPPALGILVGDVVELEGHIKTIPLEYRRLGQIVQTDYFTISNGALTLMRRIAANQSVTYRTDQNITGVKWLMADTSTDESFTTNTTAFLSRDDSSTPTAYRVTTLMPSTEEKKTPLATYDNAIKVVVGETPDHGSDLRRVFVPNVGFTLVASPFSLLGGTPSAHFLQRVRDIGTPDAGSESCSLGLP